MRLRVDLERSGRFEMVWFAMGGIAGRRRRHAVTALALAAFGLGTADLRAQTLGPLARVSASSPFSACTADRPNLQDGDFYPHSEVEPWVAANPNDPSHLIAGWQQDRWSNGGARGLAGAVSRDGGRTWTGFVPPKVSTCSGGRYLRASDPWVDIAADGTAYFMSLVFDPDLPTGAYGRNAMLVNRSTDGGRTWSDPVTLIEDGPGQVFNDKNALTADPTNPRFAYTVWDRLVDLALPPGAKADGPRGARTRARLLQGLAKAEGEAVPPLFKGPTWLARTVDGGRSWQRPRLVYDPGENAQTIGNQIVVMPGGIVVDLFTEVLASGQLRLALVRSYDKGRTWERWPSVVALMRPSPAGTATPDTGEAVRDAAILFDVAVDPRRGTLYAVWQDARFRNVDEVAFVQSLDSGNSWTAPVRINRTPANANRLRQQAFVPSIAVGADGEVVVAYYDFRNDRQPGGELADHWSVTCKARCASRASWGGERRLTTRSFDLRQAPQASGYFLGDYQGLATAGRNILPVFTVADGADGRTGIYLRPILPAR
jgi:hypothetical protein